MKVSYQFGAKDRADAFAKTCGGKVIEENNLVFVEIESKLDQIKASYDEKCEKDAMEDLYCSMNYLREELMYNLKYIREEVGYLWRDFGEHRKGHLPTNLTPGQLKNGIEVLGLEDDYQVQPRFLYASNGNKRGVMEVEYRPKN